MILQIGPSLDPIIQVSEFAAGPFWSDLWRTFGLPLQLLSEKDVKGPGHTADEKRWKDLLQWLRRNRNSGCARLIFNREYWLEPPIRTGVSLVPRSSHHRLQFLISAGCVFPALLFVMQGSVSARLNGRERDWEDVFFNLFDWLVLAVLALIPTWLGFRFPFRRAAWKPVVAVHVAGIIAFSTAWASIGMLLGLLMHHFPGVPPYAFSYLNWIFITIPFGALLYTAMLGCVYAYQYFIEAREREAEASRLAAQLSVARLDALRMQLNPHFLFNSLNTVLVLVRDKDTTAASRMLELISEVLRQVLDSSRPREVPLTDELHFVERYLAIEQVRFSDRLRVGWKIEFGAQPALVPDMIMQPLVENAIRHGVARRAQGGTVTISARVVDDSLEISVRDDGAGIKQPEAEGVGFSNTKERLRTLYGEAASMNIARHDTGGTEVVLRLPYRTSTL